jgi:hypothetical protein
MIEEKKFLTVEFYRLVGFDTEDDNAIWKKITDSTGTVSKYQFFHMDQYFSKGNIVYDRVVKYLVEQGYVEDESEDKAIVGFDGVLLDMDY